MTTATDITVMLGRAEQDKQARGDLYRAIETRFRQIAGHLLAAEQPDPALQTTVLVDDAFLKMTGGRDDVWRDREHFFCTAARVMRQLLIDYARTRQAAKRGRGEPAARLDQIAEPVANRVTDPAQLIELNDVIERLEQEHPDIFKVFDLHYFMGWTLEEIAEEILLIPLGTVRTRWRMAKAFLHRQMSKGSR